ncbi:MAG: hypothetical protein BWX80_00745 [Candidatus Hydrogenedentes bacterium ADurb.Bin101]|nr:MAG: hypothetical protein BWX80_00745 [Candidatus Hydrogenedentes bacterium ADurb.Bin101]
MNTPCLSYCEKEDVLRLVLSDAPEAGAAA